MLKKYLHSLVVVSIIAFGLNMANGQPKTSHFKAVQGHKVAKVGVSSTTYEKPKPAVSSQATQPAQTTGTASTPALQVAGANYAALVARYDWDKTIALAIMRAESQCHPNAISPPNWDGLRDYGLFQIHGVAILDPAQNVEYAYYHKYKQSGWAPWTTYTSGRYIQYLSAHC